MSFLLAGLSLLAAAQAAVTPVAVKGGCSKLPQYSSSTGIAGPWIITADHCIDRNTGDACSIDGLLRERGGGFPEQQPGRAPRLCTTTSLALAPSLNPSLTTNLQIGIVPEATQAKTPLRCNDATNAFEARIAEGDLEWIPVNVTDMAYSAQLMWGLGQFSMPVQAYEHYENGVKQDGFYLGAHNVTTWALREVPASSASGNKPYWQMRLLGPGSADPSTGKPLEDEETAKSFIRIDGIQV